MKVQTLENLANEEKLDVNELGLKTIGIVELIKLKSQLGLDYQIPSGIVIPVSGSSEREIQDAYKQLTQDLDRGVILARSSSPNEEPGKFTTLPVLVDQDKNEGYKRFREAYRTVVGSEPKAVVVQRMVGQQTQSHGRNVFGLTNTSFIMQVPSFNPDEVSISCARGLGNRVVEEDGSKVIFIDYDFVRGGVVRALDRPDEYYKEHWDWSFRQKDAECIDLETGETLTLTLPCHYAEPPEDFGRIRGDRDTFHVPFRDISEIEKLVSVAGALRKHKGKALEIEGAYLNGVLNLFQLRELESLKAQDIAFSDDVYVIGGTDTVLGSGRFTFDFVWLHGRLKRDLSPESVAGRIAQLKEDYKDKPLFVYTDYFHGALINQLGNNVRAIGTGCSENALSHTVGVVRKKIGEGRMDLFLNQCGLDVGYFGERGRKSNASYDGGNIDVYEGITVESNGRQARLFFADDKPEEAGKYDLSGLEVISLEEARAHPESLAGKVIRHPRHNLLLHISESGASFTNILDGRNYGGGSSREYSIEDVETHFKELIEFYKLDERK